MYVGGLGDFFCLHLHSYFGVQFLFPDFLFSENFSSISLSLKQGLNCERQVEKHIWIFFKMLGLKLHLKIPLLASRIYYPGHGAAKSEV